MTFYPLLRFTRHNIIWLLIPIIVISASNIYAQIPAKNIIQNARAARADLLVSENKKIQLWGIEKIESANPRFKLRARTTLDNTMQNQSIQCEFQKPLHTQAKAICITRNNTDLGLHMIQNGYATVNRNDVYNSVYEASYIQAEKNAQMRQRGVWGNDAGDNQESFVNNTQTIILGFLGLMMLGLGILSAIIMRGFRRVIDAQNDNVENMLRERKLRLKERTIVIGMLESELKTNKSKIEAHLVVYEEMMRDLLNKEKEPAYKKAGDIVQVQPSLDRTVFDKNADKLEILGQDLSSDLIHFYARIKHNPDYKNIEATTPLSDACSLVEKSLSNSQKLNERADKLIKAFEENNLSAT